MQFKKVFRGYAPKQVDDYIRDLTQKHEQIRLAQKQYMEELTEENYQLRHKVKQYQQDEQAIAKSLIESQKLAEELKNDAVRFSDLVLSRAKVFYATWQAYAKTLIATLDEQEIIQFNKLMAKIENIINAYEGKNVQTDLQGVVESAHQVDDELAFTCTEQVVQTTQEPPADVATTVVQTATAEIATEGATEQPTETTTESPDLAPSATTMGVYANPIGKVEQASQVIDLRELTKVDDSLEQLCIDLGLIPPKSVQ